MKGKKNYFAIDISLNSVTMLQNKVSTYLLDEFGINNAWYVDFYEPHRDFEFDECLDIVFFGDFLRKFLESGLWPFEKYRFWVISNSTKNVMTNLLKIPCENITVIPRYKLFPKATSFTTSQIRDFFYVGQLRPEKNIHLLLLTINKLQLDFHCSASLKIVGHFVNEDYKLEILNFVESLNWNLKPEFLGEIKNFDFSNSNSSYSCLINLSTYLYEDFNTSLAQADSAGWSSIVSAWGGHLDVEGSQHLKVPYSLIGESSDNYDELNFRSLNIATYISSNHSSSYEVISGDSKKPDMPQHIDIATLSRVRTNLTKTWGPSLYYILRQNIYLTQDSDLGFSFFRHYITEFSNIKINYKVIVILSKTKLANDLSRLISQDETYYFLHIEHVSFKESLLLMLNTEKLIIQGNVFQYIPSLKSTLETIQKKYILIS